MSTCSECEFFKIIDEDTGNCKHSHVERHMSSTSTHIVKVENGWPILNGTEIACGEFVRAN